MSMETEFREVVSRLNGLCATVEGGFREVKSELRSQDRMVSAWRTMYVATLVIALIALLLAGFAASVALGNKALIVELVRQSNMQERTLERDQARLQRLEGTPSDQAGP